MARKLGAVRADGVARPGVGAGRAGAATAHPGLAVGVDRDVAEVRVRARGRLKAVMGVDGAAAAERDRVGDFKGAPDIELPAGARQGRGPDRGRRSAELLTDGAAGHVGVARTHVVAEGDRQGDREDHLDLLLVAAVRVVDRFAHGAGKGVGTGVAGRAAPADAQAAGSRPLCGQEVVGLRDDGARRPSRAPDADRERRVGRGTIGKLLKLVALPLHGAREENQRRRADQCEHPHRDDDEHLPTLALAHQYSRVSTDWESNVIVLGIPSSEFRTGFHWSLRSTTTS